MCPRQCNIDRSELLGFCHEDQKIRVAKIIENFCWEEPCLDGKKGTLAVFFSGCNLRCEFCQNYDISHIGKGEKFTAAQFADLLKNYDYSKFDSVDLVSPTQFSWQIVEALKIFRPPVPIIWNSNGYESEKTIETVANYVDIFLADLKFFSSDLSLRLAGAKDYFEVASNTIKKMAELKTNVFEGDMMRQGLIIRHLILPGQVKDSLAILDFIAREISNPFVSIMSQFTPTGRGELNRKISPLELKTVMAHAEKIKLNQGYFQSLDSADDKFVPKF